MKKKNSLLMRVWAVRVLVRAAQEKDIKNTEKKSRQDRR